MNKETAMQAVSLSNWGNYPRVKTNFTSFTSVEELQSIVSAHEEIIARGCGRCYGDSALSATTVSTLQYNHILSFDESRGVLSCESGVSLLDLLPLIIPKGWFLPVTPGTKYVSVGGAIASDIHGKNHRSACTFKQYVTSMIILRSDGSVTQCSREENADLFFATCGGMGLTGVILSATLTLKRIQTAYIRQDTRRMNNYDEMMESFDDLSATYAVAWIDCLSTGSTMGRGLLLSGEHATREEISAAHPLAQASGLSLSVPFNLPVSIVNRLSIKTFDFLHYNFPIRKTAQSIKSFDAFFYPLDKVLHWNRFYGSKGFLQYHFVLPNAESKKGIKKILSTVQNKGMNPFLGILKLLGGKSSYLSFPLNGFSLAMDFPITSRLFLQLDELDRLVAGYGGRIYLAKDARMNAKVFECGYEELGKFREVKQRYDTTATFTSCQSKRLLI